MHAMFSSIIIFLEDTGFRSSCSESERAQNCIFEGELMLKSAMRLRESKYAY